MVGAGLDQMTRWSSPAPTSRGQHLKARVTFRRGRIGDHHDRGRRPRMCLYNRSCGTSESSEHVGPTQIREFVEPASVLAGHDNQALELGSADHDDVLINVLGDVGGVSLRVVVPHPLRNRTSAAFRFLVHAMVGKSRQPMVLTHAMPPNGDFDCSHS